VLLLVKFVGHLVRKANIHAHYDKQTNVADESSFAITSRIISDSF